MAQYFNPAGDDPMNLLQQNAIAAQGNNQFAYNVDSLAPAQGVGYNGLPGFNLAGPNAMGNLQLAIGGIQTLGSLWNSYQQNRLAQDALGFQKKAYKTNLKNQTQSYNTALEDRIRSRYATEGRASEADAYIDKNKL